MGYFIRATGKSTPTATEHRSVIETLSRRAPISVVVDGVNVVLTLGNRAVSLDYDTANRLAVLLRGNGKIAKRNAGDLSVKLIGFANLTDAVMEEHKIQKSRDPTAVYSLKPRA